MKLRSAGLWALLAMSSSAFGQAGVPAPVAEDVGVATLDQEGFSGGVSLNGTFFDIRHQTNSGVGYRGGFTQFGAFAPIWNSSRNWYVAPTGKLILTDDAATGFNGGLVSRMYSERFDRIIGVNAFYDYDTSSNSFNYNQVGFGAESLGKYIDLRGNAYIPTSKDSNFLRATGLSQELVFFDNRLGFIGSQLVEQSLAGGDAEVGAPLHPNAPWLRGYVGGYGYRKNDGDTFAGFRGRVEGWVTDDLQLGAMVTTDDLFGTNVNFTIDWRFAGFKPTRRFPQWDTYDRMLIPVQRHWRISTAQIEETVNVAGDNPRDGLPYFVVWVDPDSTNPGTGTGTYEDPFTSMPANVPNETDLVMILRGDTTQAAPMESSITLPDFARMLGEGREHIASVTLTSGPFLPFFQGDVTGPLPDARFADTGLYPFLTSPAGQNIINVGSHNEVAAFVLQGTPGNGNGAAIAGANVDGFHFHHLEITGNDGGGIVLTNARGSGLITVDGQSILGGQITDINRNVVVDWTNPFGTGVGDNALAGIDITTGVGALDLNLERISMNASPGAQEYGIRLRTGMGRLGVNMQDIETSGGNVVAGVSIEQNTGEIDAFIGTADPLLPSLISNDNNGVGLQLLTGSLRPFDVNAINVQANGNAGNNLSIADNPIVALPFNTTFNATFTDSTFDGSLGGAGVSLSMTAGAKSLSLQNVSASGNATFGVNLLSTAVAPPPTTSLTFTADALVANANNDTNLNIALTETRFVGNVTSNAGNSSFDNSVTGTGIALDATAGTASLNLNTVSASNNAVNGLTIGAHGGALIGNPLTPAFDGVNVIDSTLTGNGVDSIAFVTDGGSFLDLFVDPTDLSLSGRHGLFGQTNGAGSRSNVSMVDVTILDGGTAFANSSGVLLQGTGGSRTDLSITGASTIGNTSPGGTLAHGLAIDSQNAGTIINVTATDTNLNNAGINAVLANVDAGTGSLTLTNVTGNNSGFEGLSGSVATGGVLNLELDTVQFSGSGEDGLNVLVTSASVFNACIENSTFDGNGFTGIRIDTSDSGTESNVHIEGTSVDGNTQGGLVANVAASAELNLRTVNSSFDANGTFGSNDFDGVFVSADDATARLLFNTTSADNNSRNGFNFSATNGAYMTSRIDTISSQDNGSYGVQFAASDAGTIALLIPEGTNTIQNNGLGAYNITYTNTDVALVAMTGSFNGLASDGVFVDLNNVTSAFVSVIGDGTDTIDSNAGHGINISVTDVEQVGVRIEGYASISSNTGDGIHIALSNVVDNGGTANAPAAAIQITGPTDLIDNGDDGVEIVLNDVVLGSLTTPTGLDPLSVVSLTANDPLNDCLPEPTTADFNTIVAVPTSNGIEIDGLNIGLTGAPSGTQAGIAISGTDVSGTGEIVLTNNTIDNFDNGIQATFTDIASFAGLTVSGSTITNSTGTGVDVVLTPTTTGGFDITMDSLTVGSSGGRGVSIAGTGALGDISLTNVSVTDSLSDGIAIDLATGSSVNSVTIDGQGTASVQNSNGNGILVSMLGTPVAGDITISNYLVESSTAGDGINLTLDNVISGNIVMDANTVNASSGDGIALFLDGVTGAPDVSTTNSNIDGSGAIGINLSAVGATLGNVLLDPSSVSNSQEDGVLLNFTNGTVGDVTVLDFTISDSGLGGAGDGLDIILDGTTSTGTVLVQNTTVDNSNGRGVYIHGANGTNPFSLGDIRLDNVTSTFSNTADGIAVDLDGTGTVANIEMQDVTAGFSNGVGVHVELTGGVTVNSIDLTNVSSAFSASEGLFVDLDNVTINSDITLTGGPNSFVAYSGLTTPSDGIRVELNAVTGTPNVSVTDYANVSFNDGNGIHVVNSVTAPVGTVTVSDNVVDNSLSGDGINVDLFGSVGGVVLDGNTVSNSDDNGISVVLFAVTSGTPDVTISNSTSTNTTNGDGITVFTTASTIGDILIDTVSATNSAINGVIVEDFLFAPSIINSITINEANAATSGGVGVGIGLFGTTVNDIAITGPGTVTDSGDDGVTVQLTGVNGTPNVTIDGYTVDDSGNRGISIETDSDLNDVTVSNFVVSDSGLITADSQGVLIDLTDVAVNTLTVSSTSTNTITRSDGRGLDVILDGATLAGAIDISDTSVSNSGQGTNLGRGVSVSGVGSAGSPMTLGTITLTNVSSNTTGAEEGVIVDLSADAAANGKVGDITLTNVSAVNSFGAGVVTSLNTLTFDPTISIDGQGTANATGNGGDGIVVRVTDVTSTPGPMDIVVDGYASVDNNAFGGVVVEADGSLIDSLTVSNNLIRNNLLGNGITIDLTNASNTNSLTISGNTISDNSSDGILISQDNSNVGPIGLSNNSISENDAHGVNFSLTNSSQGTVTLTENVISGHTAGDGVHVDPLLDTDNAINFNFVRNTISGNTGGHGVNFDLIYGAANSNVLTVNFENDTIVGSGQAGISIAMNQALTANITINSNATTANPVSGNFQSSISNNVGGGLLVTTDDTATFDLTVGGTGGQNLFSGNRNAGIGLILNNGPQAQTGFSTFDISNVELSNTVLGANANFTGEGLGIVISDSAILRDATVGDSATLNTTIADNAGDGVRLFMQQSGIVSDLLIQNADFTETNAIGDTQNNGVNVIRRDDAKLTGLVIAGNSFTNHVADGINLDLLGGDNDIEAPFGTLVMDVLIGGATAPEGNTFTSNQRGVDILVSADARLDIDMRFNTFDSNEADGVRTQTDFNAVIEDTSLWQDETFLNNGGSAINLATTRDSLTSVTIQRATITNTAGVGLDGIQLTSNLNSEIELNVSDTTITGVGRDGIQVDNSSTLNIDLNLTDVTITTPTQDGIDLNNTGDGDINFTSLRTTVTGTGVGTGNGLLATASGAGTLDIDSTDDIFSTFGADGISLQGTGVGNIDATFTDVQSRFNVARGVELLNSGSADLDVTIIGTTDPRPTDGAVADVRIEANGLNGVFVENNAGVLSTDNDINLTITRASIRGNGILGATNDERTGLLLRAGTSTFGALTATIQENVLSGNQGVDFSAVSFAATPDPAVASPYTAANVLDPVARLGLDFRFNEGDQIDLTRAGATYSNADAFKSPGAFFTSTSRLRNAQRLALDFPALVVGGTITAAASNTSFTGDGVGEGGMPQGVFTNLGMQFTAGPNAGQIRDINGYNAGTNVFTTGAFGATPVVGNTFDIFAEDISGVGRSTFRTISADVTLDNSFTSVLSNFGATVGIGGANGGPLFGNPQTFTWSQDLTPFTFDP